MRIASGGGFHPSIAPKLRKSFCTLRTSNGRYAVACIIAVMPGWGLCRSMLRVRSNAGSSARHVGIMIGEGSIFRRPQRGKRWTQALRAIPRSDLWLRAELRAAPPKPACFRVSSVGSRPLDGREPVALAGCGKRWPNGVNLVGLLGMTTRCGIWRCGAATFGRKRCSPT